MKNKIIAFIIFTTLLSSLYCQNVYIPDQIFKARLIDLGVDQNNDNEISFDEAAMVNDLDISFNGTEPIEDITGIEAFISLDTLICLGNMIITLDSLDNLPIKYLDCTWNPILSIQFSLPELVFLKCTGNSLSLLDASIFPQLHILICSPADSLIIDNAFLNKLIVESNIIINTTFAPELNTLICYTDSAPDLSNNSQLKYLEIVGQFPTVDVSTNLLLKHLYLWGNLISIDISNNTVLTYLNLLQNNLLNLDVSNNLEIDTLICRINSISSLDLSNNSNLLYIDCSGNNITDLDVSNLSNLKTLLCVGNQLTDINLNDNIALSRLEVSSNQLNSINLTNNTALEDFICASNNISGAINLSQNTKLKHINCSENSLQTLDLSSNTMLREVWCQQNNLVYLNINGLVNLLGLHCFMNNLEQLDLYSNISITWIQCGYNPIDSLDLSHNNSWDLVNLTAMPNLTKVCVSELPVTYTINTSGSPNVVIEVCSFVGLGDKMLNTMTIYPNPTNGNLFIENINAQNSTASLYNINGKLVLKTNLTSGRQVIEIPNLPNGFYILEIHNDHDIIVRKILKK